MLIYRYRYAVIVLGIVLSALSGLYGADLADRWTQEGWFDDSSESVHGSKLADDTFGRDTSSDVVALYTAPPGRTVDDFAVAARARFDALRAAHPDHVLRVDSYWDNAFTTSFADASRTHAFASIGLKGEGQQTLSDYTAIRDELGIEGMTVQVAGVQPLVYEINQGMQADIHRAELIALPLVAILLFFIFGGVTAALLPVLVGGLTIVASQGIMRIVMSFVEVNAFASAVVTLVSLGLAIDYGLFVVSRFREEIAEGRTPEEAVARTVASAGRTVLFSASIIAASLGALLVFPHGVLRSVPFGAISSVVLAAVLSTTVLPAVLGVLGPRVDSLGLFARTRTHAQIDASVWSRLARWAMRRPIAVTGVVGLVLIALIVPFKNVEFGALSEKYLATDNPARVAQQDYDRIFPQFRTEPLKLVVVGADNAELGRIRADASAVPGLTSGFEPARETKDSINVLEAGLVDRGSADEVIAQLRALPRAEGVQLYVAGIPALERDSIHGIVDRLPLLVGLLALATFLLLWFAFGSVVLAVKAIVVSSLSLGSTLGMLTWVFVDGHGATLLDVTPGPLMFAVVVLIVTVIIGLSTDYEVFLLSRMVEARRAGADTPEAIRYGTAHTGGVITAAASILIVVTGAFALSDLVMMKYIAYGMIAALVLDATVIRLLLVPAVMRLLGDWCWWSPAWLPRRLPRGTSRH